MWSMKYPPATISSKEKKQKKKGTAFSRCPFHISREQNCKPGSVFDSHLSSRGVAAAIQPPRERPGRPWDPASDPCSHIGVAPNRVYSDGHSRAVGCALTAPFHPYLAGTQSGGAVSLCCTFPEVAFGGRYPLSLPCGARTFLMYGLSACTRDCLSYSRRLF